MTIAQTSEIAKGDAKQNSAWYLVQCKPNAERVAIKNIRDQNFTAFLPLQKVTRRKANSFQTPLRPLFPGYVFVEIDPVNGHWQKINSTRGVIRLVRFGLYPCPVPPNVMQFLFSSCNKDSVFESGESLLAGDRIKVTHGPFTGFAAKIADISADKRVYLLLEIMGQTSIIKIRHDHLLKVT